MGVYIEGMKMPPCCDECDFVRENNYEMTEFCLLTGKETLYEKERRKDCPLVEIPKGAEVAMTAEGLKMVYIPMEAE